MRKDEDEIVQVLNPKVNRYMKINKTIGAIIGVKKSSGPYKNILIVEKNKEGGSMKKTNDELELELAQLKDKYQKLEFEIAELKEVMDWQAYFINEITNTEYELTPTISSKEKKKIYCDCCGEEMPKDDNFSFEIDLACEACQRDLSLATSNMIDSIRKSNNNLFLTRVEEKKK